MGELMVRHRTGLDRGARVLRSARASALGLQLPGTVSAGTRWRGRLDVVLLPHELRVAGHGGIWRYPLREMVLASDGGAGPGGLRVDFLMGPPLVATLDDRGALLRCLRFQVAAVERSLTSTTDEAAWQARGRLVALTPGRSDATLTTAIDLLLDRAGRRPVAVADPGRADGPWSSGSPMLRLVEDLQSRRWDLLLRREAGA
jgi:hypothetical protein